MSYSIYLHGCLHKNLFQPTYNIAIINVVYLQLHLTLITQCQQPYGYNCIITLLNEIYKG